MSSPRPSPRPAADPLTRLLIALASLPDTEVLPEILADEDTDLDQPWHVIIFNDPVNLMSYVTMVIRRIFGYGKDKAEQMMLDVHQKGKCIVWTGGRERAELYVRQLQEHQLLCSMKKAG
ncbi:MAG: ATP-dependent Clp protease adapter ClpS [Verrucomicrobiota bacterium]